MRVACWTLATFYSIPRKSERRERVIHRYGIGIFTRPLHVLKCGQGRHILFLQRNYWTRRILISSSKSTRSRTAAGQIACDRIFTRRWKKCDIEVHTIHQNTTVDGIERKRSCGARVKIRRPFVGRIRNREEIIVQEIVFAASNHSKNSNNKNSSHSSSRKRDNRRADSHDEMWGMKDRKIGAP